jgi:hypothetical protein
VPTLQRPPQAQLATRDDTRSPLKVKPGWATHTPFPNFGKVEYFCDDGLTASQVFCPTGRDMPWRTACKRFKLSKCALNHSKITHRGFKQFYFARVEFPSLHQ